MQNKEDAVPVSQTSYGWLFFAAAIIAAIVMPYNGLMRSKNEAVARLADIQVMEVRRSDLIPNLVKTAGGIAEQEREVFRQVTEARSRIGQLQINATSSPEQIQEFIGAQTALSGSIGRLLATVENYPDLKSAASFRELQAQLEGAENRIAVARRDYNAAVQGYNTKQDLIWYILACKMSSHAKLAFFEASPDQRKVPGVDFSKS